MKVLVFNPAITIEDVNLLNQSKIEANACSGRGNERASNFSPDWSTRGTRFSANGSVARKKEQFEEERSRCRNVRTSNFCRDVALSE